MVVLLHVTDVHCSFDNLSYVLSSEQFDVAVISGDLECAELIDTIRSAGRPVVAVTGNLDDISVRRSLESSGLLIDGRLAEVGGVRFAGVGGIDPLSDIRSLAQLKPERVDVLVSHHPPRGILDRTYIGVRIGLREVRELALKIRPRLHLFGHVHEDRGVDEYEGIVAVNAGPLLHGYYSIIRYEAGQRPQVELRRLAHSQQQT